MKPPIHDLSPVPGRGSTRTNPPGHANVAEVDRQIAELKNRSTHELRVAWRQSYGTGPPLGLSRDLLIRALAHQLQEQSCGGVGRALRRRLQSLAGASEKATIAVDPGLVLRAGTALVRQWRGHTHTVLVHADGFEHEGQRYRSLTAIAERITEAHWSGPRFFGLTKRECVVRRQGRPMTRSAGSGTRRGARVRCAIYTRKSSEEGLEQEFNSLQAQREACEAFITSQRVSGSLTQPPLTRSMWQSAAHISAGP
jgi:hypothetical protein